MGYNISHVHRPLWTNYLFHCNLASHTALSLMHGKSSLGWRRWKYSAVCAERRMTLKARFMGPIWDPSGVDRTQVGPVLAPRTLLSGKIPRFHTGLSENHGPVIITFVIHFHTLCNMIMPSSTVDHQYMYHRNRAIPNVYLRNTDGHYIVKLDHMDKTELNQKSNHTIRIKNNFHSSKSIPKCSS